MRPTSRLTARSTRSVVPGVAVVAAGALALTACQLVLGIDAGQERSGSVGGSGGESSSVGPGGGGSGGDATGGGGDESVCSQAVDVSSGVQIATVLGNPRQLEADAQHVYFLASFNSVAGVFRFEHQEPSPSPGLFEQADGPGHDVDGLTLSTDHVAWITTSNSIARVKTRAKTAGSNSGTLFYLTPGSPTPLAADGHTIYFTAATPSSERLFFESAPPHTQLADADGSFAVNGDRSLAVGGDAAYVASATGITRHLLPAGESLTTTTPAPTHLLLVPPWLYWTSGNDLLKSSTTFGSASEQVASSPGSILDFVVVGECAFWVDSEGHLATAYAGGSPVVLETLPEATSLVLTDAYLFVSVAAGATAGHIIRFSLRESL